MFKRLVVGIDGSACASHAFDLALDLAKVEGAQVKVCCVAEPPAVYPCHVPGIGTQRALMETRNQAERVVDEAVASAKAAGIEAEGRVVVGDPVYEIVGYARKQQADAIVLGTHGRSGLKRLFMGSVAEGVLRCSAVPVLTVRQEANAAGMR